MCRSLSRLVLASLAAITIATSVHAGPPPSGSITCPGLAGKLEFGAHGLPTPFNIDHPQTTQLKISGAGSGVCDASGVVGGRGTIEQAHVSLRGRVVEGETCADFFDTLAVEKTKVAVRWLGVNAYGRLQTIATSKASVASAAYDDIAQKLVVTTAPIAHGAFAGSTITLRMGYDGMGFESGCFDLNGAIIHVTFGADGTTTISVP